MFGKHFFRNGPTLFFTSAAQCSAVQFLGTGKDNDFPVDVVNPNTWHKQIMHHTSEMQVGGQVDGSGGGVIEDRVEEVGQPATPSPFLFSSILVWGTISLASGTLASCVLRPSYTSMETSSDKT